MFRAKVKGMEEVTIKKNIGERAMTRITTMIITETEITIGTMIILLAIIVTIGIINM
jgi:hypothetical protein